MDADFSHNPADLIRLRNACVKDGHDVAIGSRYISGVNVVNWPLNRVLLSLSASRYVRMITGMPIKDPTAGFVCYSKKVLQKINLLKVKFIGYAFQIEMKHIVWKAKFKIIEIPIIFTDRVKGKSKMSTSIFKEAFWGVIGMRFSGQKDKLKE
jgi:dolichol-phosphate mannosyltransferase